MADIHIGKITQTRSDKGKAHLYYHIALDKPIVGIVPTPESEIKSLLLQPEIDALAAGTLVEVTRDMVIFSNQTTIEIAGAIKADYNVVKSKYNNKFTFEHKFYGSHLNANP
jgi:hypothetical protein